MQKIKYYSGSYSTDIVNLTICKNSNFMGKCKPFYENISMQRISIQVKIIVGYPMQLPHVIMNFDKIRFV